MTFYKLFSDFFFWFLQRMLSIAGSNFFVFEYKFSFMCQKILYNRLHASVLELIEYGFFVRNLVWPEKAILPRFHCFPS